MNENRIKDWEKFQKDFPIIFKVLKETLVYGDEINEYLSCCSNTKDTNVSSTDIKTNQ